MTNQIYTIASGDARFQFETIVRFGRFGSFSDGRPILQAFQWLHLDGARIEILAVAVSMLVVTSGKLFVNFDILFLDVDIRNETTSDVSAGVAILDTLGVISASQIIGISVNDQSTIENAVRLVLV